MLIIYGGSFNPPTLAHQSIFKLLMKTFNPDRFVFLPVGNHYPKKDLAPFQARLEMLELLFSNPKVTVSNLEENQFHGTVKALDYFRQEDADLYFVIGADNLKEMHSWIESERLLSSYQFIVMDRDHEALPLIQNEFSTYQDHFKVLNTDLKESSSAFRKDPTNLELLDPIVYQYIIKHHLYGV